MDTTQINSFLKNCKCFIGTFPRNMIKKIKIKKKPAALIVNTDDSNEKGEHWVAIFLNKRDGSYFDSFGLAPLHQDFIRFMDHHCDNWNYSSNTLQQLTSSTCGYYCILFVLMRCKGFSFRQFLKIFSNKATQNDQKIKKMLRP